MRWISSGTQAELRQVRALLFKKARSTARR